MRAIEIAIVVLMYVLALGMLVGVHAANCPPEGDARPGTMTWRLNPLKNRTAAPGDPARLTVADMLAWPESENTAREAEGAMLTGKLLAYKHEGPESCNCHSKTRKDFHIWIGETKARAVIVELSPWSQEAFPSLVASLHRLKGRNVCVTGLPFFDAEHGPQVGKSRGTLWELHPVTAIAAC